MLASDPTYPLFPVLAFVGFVLCAIPLSWHFQAWNSGTCAFMIWTGLACLVTGINSVIWADTALNLFPVWCDISSQIILGASIGIPASTLCINRRLFRITSTQTVSITRDDKLRAIYSDHCNCRGNPYFGPDFAFDIIEEIGCTSVTYNTLPAYFLYYQWPIAIGLVSLVYSSLILRSFYMRRVQFAQVSSSNRLINPSRYLRLMALALIDIMCTIPISIYTIYVSLNGTLQPWISWEDTHFDFGFVQPIPSVIWRSDPKSYASVQITRWVPIACACIFFALFGFAEEAMKNYRRMFWFFSRRLGFQAVSKGGVNGFKNFKLKPDGRDMLPVYIVPTDSGMPSARQNIRKSMLDAESRSTICFPDDEVELGPYRKSLARMDLSNGPSSPSSSTSTCSPRTPVTPSLAPPAYVDSAFLDAAASALDKQESYSQLPSPTESFMTPPGGILEEPESSSRPSSYSSPSCDHDRDEDDISISDAYLDSRGPSPVQMHPAIARVPTPVPFIASQLPAPQHQLYHFTDLFRRRVYTPWLSHTRPVLMFMTE
ncbi:STE3-domain-containing protein [Gymnopus androsaceus JB14]|uniref:STE3-domain-containing protein n=1 Tax=Gymnopus androsaceus JB14 TaxID=1447944 RepID=A0A6A4HF30_9AGAR|nr:STE3-domain-containing protein [Gymnopus androsaceus JB14]